ncbi:MAG: hypothetical protein P8Y45_02200 [Exilibacterium sp.]
MPAAIFGLFTTLGLGLTFLLTVILIPLLLDLWRPTFEISNQTGNVVVKSNHRIFDRLPAFVARQPVLTLLLSLLPGVPIMAGTAFLKVDSNRLAARPIRSPCAPGPPICARARRTNADKAGTNSR